jgi:hypothetical protein
VIGHPHVDPLPPASSHGTVRHDVRIDAPADVVWARVADAPAIASWFPGMQRSSCSQADPWERTVVTGTGIPLVEDIVLVDHVLRRFEYRLRPNALVRDHRGVIDVITLDERSCLTVYSTTVEPRVFALAIGSGTLHALHELRRQCEAHGYGEGT